MSIARLFDPDRAARQGDHLDSHHLLELREVTMVL